MKNRNAYCFTCSELVGFRDVVCVVDRIYHRKCFKCHSCGRDLDAQMFSSYMADLYCEKHCPSWTENRHLGIGGGNSSLPASSNDRLDRRSEPSDCVCQRSCIICNQPIQDWKTSKAPIGVFHNDCFRCADCQQLLDTAMYRVVQGLFLCEPSCSTTSNFTDPEENVMPPMQNGNSSNASQDTKSALLQKPKYQTVCFKCAQFLGTTNHYMVSEKQNQKHSFKCQRCNLVLTQPQCTLVDDLSVCETGLRNNTFINPKPLEEETTNDDELSHVASPSSDQRATSKSLRLRSKAQMSPRTQRRVDIPSTCVANAEKVALLQRKLEEIQTSAMEDKNCHVCGKKVYPAEQLNTLNRIYHVRCFQCHVCHKPICNAKYQVFEGNPYCIPHFKQLNTLKSISSMNISNQSLNPTTQKTSFHHMDHTAEFPIIKGNTIIENEEEIFQQQFEEPLCPICSMKVQRGEEISAMNQTFHQTCFKCQTCQRALSAETYESYDGVLYCKMHYKTLLNVQSELHAQMSAVDTSSKENVSKHDDEHNKKGGSRYMLKHAISETVLNWNKANSARDAEETVRCYSCEQKVYPAEQLSILKRIYHKGCFKCGTCHKVLNVTNYGVHEGIPYCNAHHKQALNTPASLHRSGQVINTNVLEHSEQKQYVTASENAKKPSVLKGQSASHSKTRCFDCKRFTNPKNSLILMDRVYHSDCLRCTKCHISLGRWTYKESNGLIYCPKHYAEIPLTQRFYNTYTQLSSNNVSTHIIE